MKNPFLTETKENEKTNIIPCNGSSNSSCAENKIGEDILIIEAIGDQEKPCKREIRSSDMVVLMPKKDMRSGNASSVIVTNIPVNQEYSIADDEEDDDEEDDEEEIESAVTTTKSLAAKHTAKVGSIVEKPTTEMLKRKPVDIQTGSGILT